MIDKQATLGAVNLKVADLNKMTAFYKDVIGLQLLESTAETATLGTPNRPLVRLRHNPNGRFSRRASGLFHIALRVSSRAALAQWLRAFAEAGAPGWQGASDHLVSEALYLNDPEGNGIEVYYDRPRTQWQYGSEGELQMATLPLDLEALVGEAESDEFASIDPETEMGHVHLRVSDIHPAQDFYVDLLGFDLMAGMSGSALFVAAGGYHHHLGMNVWQSKGGENNSADIYGLDQFEICFESAESRQQTIDRLMAHNHHVDQSGEIPLVHDPFQNTIALTTSGTG